MSQPRFAVLSLALLAACGAHPLQQREDAETLSWVVETAPESTYRNIVEHARDCYMRKTEHVSGDYYPESRTGVVAFRMGTDLSGYELLRVEVSPSTVGVGSSVKMTTRRGFTRFRPAVEAWSAGRDAECPYRERSTTEPRTGQ